MAETSNAPSKLQALMDRAKAARKEREKAPLTGVGTDIRIPQKDIIKRLCKDQGGKNDAPDGMHRLTIPATKLKEYSEKGYAPCIEDGDIVRYQSDVFVEIPTKFYEEELKANKARDARVTRHAMKDASQPRATGKTALGVAKTGSDTGNEE